MKFSTKIILITILFIASLFRFYGLNWDQGVHLHPDERAIIMTAERLSFPKDFSTFLSVTSPWNPNFFAYGSLPFYLLYFVGQLLSPLNPEFAHYAMINIPGRVISAMSDIATLFVLFLLGRKLFNTTTALLAAFLYAISVLPIQLSHFYAVDTLLTFFILLTLYQLIVFYEKPSLSRALLIGVFFGMALATKISASVLVIAVGASLGVDFLLLFLKQPHKPAHWLPHVPLFLKQLCSYAIVIMGTTVTTFIFFEPYALIDFKNFWTQTLQQSAMTKDAFTFPYTLQYVGKIPYLYELTNIFLFGLGPLLATLAFSGIGYFVLLVIRKNKQKKWAQEFILLTFFFVYFLTVGNFAIGFMRYMLPLYPIFCLSAAVLALLLIKRLYQKIKNKTLIKTILIAVIILFFIWPLSFVQIYNKNNTRVDATNWIAQNIPPGTMIVVEHWDDRLPLTGSEQYIIEDLELYNPDTDEKWRKITDQLDRADYMIIASNRLYTPLQKLIDCPKLPPHRCYKRSAFYYQQLLSGKSNYRKVAEFTSYPTIPFFELEINDQAADESFTVYDHPKIMIFKKQ